LTLVYLTMPLSCCWLLLLLRERRI
jgi:hypothetical protein